MVIALAGNKADLLDARKVTTEVSGLYFRWESKSLNLK